MVTSITPLPDAPQRIDQPSTFIAKADAHVAALTPWTTQVNVLGGEVQVLGDDAATDAASAAADALTASNAVAIVSGTSTTTVSIGTGAKTWTIETGKAFVIGMNVKIAEDGDPVSNFMNGVVTQYITGTGQLDITVSEATGSGSFSAWTISTAAAPAVGATVDFQEFLTSGTWNKPAGAVTVFVENIGGGAGGWNNNVGDAAGGGGGGYTSKLFQASDLTSSVVTTIGAGGVGGATGAANVGSDGGDTTFAAFLTATGGFGLPQTIAFQGTAGRGGDAGGGERGGHTASSQPDGQGGYSSGGGGGAGSSVAGGGGRCMKGGGGGGSVDQGVSAVGLGGTSLDGGNGGDGNVTSSTKGGNGVQPGGGGGGSANQGGGGDGAAGRIRVWTTIG